jgi:hypothetical protein
MDVREGAVRLALAHRGAYGFDDDCVTHGAGLLGRRATTGVRAGAGTGTNYR